MRSGGFGLGKKQNRGGDIKRTPPGTGDLTQLLSAAQKNPDKPFALSWMKTNNENSVFTLTVTNSGAQRDRRGWSQSAIDNAVPGEAEWKLSLETDGLRSDLFAMRCSDAYLIQTLIDEALATGATPFAAGAGAAAAPAPAKADSGYAAQVLSHNPPSPQSTPGVIDGNLRQANIRALLENFNVNKTTGRLIVDIGTMQTEVFLKDGEPVHAKSSHSISQGRDTVGDAALIDLLTWKDGTYKFQEGWPAASKSISSPLHMFLSGSVTVVEAPTPAPSAPASNQPIKENTPAPPAPRANRAPFQAVPGSQDDFSLTDNYISETYSSLVDPYGLIKLGMLLMLTRTEIMRFEKTQLPFCFACIELHLPPGVQITAGAVTKIGERFEKIGQPLDTLSFAGGHRFYALFPQTTAATAAQAIKQFMNNIVAIPLDTNLHGSAVKFTAGVSEMPRDGSEFKEIFDSACELRGKATQEKKIVSDF